MAVDTRSKRSAALRFGSSHRAGTRPPTGTISVFERGALLGLYYQVPAPVDFGEPKDGWSFSRDFDVWNFGRDNVVWNFGD